MGQEHLIKTITHSWRVGAKIMKQSKQVLKIQRQTTKTEEERARFFSPLRANVTNGQTFGGNSSKINSAHILMLGRP